MKRLTLKHLGDGIGIVEMFRETHCTPMMFLLFKFEERKENYWCEDKVHFDVNNKHYN